jgi:hypothetical protein
MMSERRVIGTTPHFVMRIEVDDALELAEQTEVWLGILIGAGSLRNGLERDPANTRHTFEPIPLGPIGEFGSEAEIHRPRPRTIIWARFARHVSVNNSGGGKLTCTIPEIVRGRPKP